MWKEYYTKTGTIPKHVLMHVLCYFILYYAVIFWLIRNRCPLASYFFGWSVYTLVVILSFSILIFSLLHLVHSLRIMISYIPGSWWVQRCFYLIIECSISLLITWKCECIFFKLWAAIDLGSPYLDVVISNFSYSSWICFIYEYTAIKIFPHTQQV